MLGCLPQTSLWIGVNHMSRTISWIVMVLTFVFVGCREEWHVTMVELNLVECFVDQGTTEAMAPSGGICRPALTEYVGDKELVVCLVVDSDNNHQTCTGLWKPGGDIVLEGCSSKSGELEELNTEGDKLEVRLFLMDVGVPQCPADLEIGTSCANMPGCLLALRSASEQTDFEDKEVSLTYGDQGDKKPCQPECARSELCLAPGASVASCLNPEPTEGEGEGEGEGPLQGEGEGEGEEPPLDECDGCTKPPPNECDGQGNAVEYGSPGICVNGERCLYDEDIRPCRFGCSDGRCKDDPCPLGCEGEGEGSAVEGEGEPPAGEGEGDAPPPGEGEGEGGEGEGPPAGEGEGEGVGEGEGEPDPCEGLILCEEEKIDCDGSNTIIVRCEPNADGCLVERREPTPDGWSCVPPTGPDGFLMGSPPDEVGRGDDEVQHRVVITRPFIIQQTEVTQAEWRALMGNNPSAFPNCDDCPVEQTHWYDALAYANALSRAEGLEECYVLGDASWPRGLDCTGYRLPTEAEWEYAARAGSQDARYAEPLADIGWYGENSGARTNPVGQKLPNGLDLSDTLGNVWEYVWDINGAYPAADPVDDPTGPAEGPNRVIRGGAWNHLADDCRAANRSATNPGSRGGNIGFRLVRTIQ